MNYYEVAVTSTRHRGHEPLTYSSGLHIRPGSIVAVPFGKAESIGVVMAPTSRASLPADITVRDITRVDDQIILSKPSLHLIKWLAGYYPAPLGIISGLFLPKYSLDAKPTMADLATEPLSPKKLPPLTKDQTKALGQIKKSSSSILHGETGSGKTRVYIELAKDELTKGRSVLILTPEIALTPQLVSAFSDTFGDLVSTTHSGQSPAARGKLWRLVQAAKSPKIIIGPRSALFLPFSNLGLVVIDEFHEPAYKHEPQPHYHAVRVASALAKFHGSKLVLGSATPDITDYYYALQKKVPIVRMKMLAKATSDKPKQISIVDIRGQKPTAQGIVISPELKQAVTNALEQKQQSLIFLNRRGTARLVICNSCGWQATCPNCSLSLIYHGDSHNLRCHACGLVRPAPDKCPECGNLDIVLKGAGTKAVEQAFVKLFPSAHIKRFDTDNPKAQRVESHYEDLKNGKIDILIGTQILAKGLDLPNLNTVGIILADSSLALPDYTAEERTYQLLSQIAGRVGRGHKSVGLVVIQTLSPESKIINQAAYSDWDAYYGGQITMRKDFGFPPFWHMLKIVVIKPNDKSAEQLCQKLITDIRKSNPTLTILGPAPGFYGRRGGKAVWQIIVKSKNRQNLANIIKGLPPGIAWDIDPNSLL